MNEEYLRKKPEYVGILEDILEYEEENKGMERPVLDRKGYDVLWSSSDVGVMGVKVYQLEVNDFVERVYDSNKHTDYALKDREKVKEMLEKVKEQDLNEDGTPKEVMHEYPTEEELPDDLFDDVIGYDDVKWLLTKALTTDDITNILMIGPPGSAKTVFLMAINKLDSSIFVSGAPTSGPGVLDILFERTPMLVNIDEFDDMDNDTQKVLSQYTETGILDETKVDKTRTMKTNTSTFASANYEDKIIDQIFDRFLPLYFDPYTRKEYIEICMHVLPNEEGSTEEEAKKIAEEVWNMEGTGDVRKAMQIARISDGEPEKVIGILENYSGDDGLMERL